MRYTVLVSNSEITYQQYNKLNEAGAVVPYDSEGQNYYFYTQDGFDLDSIKHILDFYSTNMSVDYSEIEKQLNKIRQVNIHKTGETVFCYNKYRNLPLTILKADKDKVEVFFKLKGHKIDEVLDVKEIQKAEKYYDYDCSIPAEKTEKLIIDCDSISSKNFHKIEYINSIILLLIRIKSQYSGYTLIISNPDEILLFIAQIFGLFVGYGNIRDILTSYKESICFTNDFRMLNYCNKIIYLNKDNQIEHYTEDDLHRRYHMNIGNVVSGYLYYDGKNRYNYFKDENKDLYKKDTPIIYSNIKNLNIDKVRDVLLSVGLQDLASNAQYFLRELHK